MDTSAALVVDVDTLQKAVAEHNWPYVAACVIFLLVRVSKLPIVGNYWDKIPKAYRPLIPVVLGMLSGVGEALMSNRPWVSALVFGVFSGLLAIGVDQAVTKPLAPAPPTPPTPPDTPNLS